MLNRKRSTSLALSLLLLGQVVGTSVTSRAGDFDLQSTADTKDNKTTTDLGHFRPPEVHADVRLALRLRRQHARPAGHDHHSDHGPGRQPGGSATPFTTKTVSRTVDVDTSSSAFLNFSLGVGYTAANPRLSLTIGADVGVNYYFDRPGRDYDVNGGLSGRLTYRLAPRLLIEASTYNAYEAAGDYGATTLTNFNGQFNGGTPPPGTRANRNGDFFYTTNYLAGTYQFSPADFAGGQRYVRRHRLRRVALRRRGGPDRELHPVRGPLSAQAHALARARLPVRLHRLLRHQRRFVHQFRAGGL